MKRELAGVILLILTVVPFSSGGLFDFFKGDVRESPVNVGVGVGGTAPKIKNPLPDIVDRDNPILSNEINPRAGLTNIAEVRFVARDSSGIADLPGGVTSIEAIDLATSVGEVAAGTANMEVYVTSPLYGTNVLATTCAEDPACPNCGSFSNAREYICEVPMEYYLEPDTQWEITAEVADSGDLSDSNKQKRFVVNSLTAFSLSGGITWNSINLSAVDQVADSALGLTNIGNVDITQGDVTGRDLTPSATGDNLPVNAFTISTQTGGAPLAECDDTDHPSGGGVTADELVDNSTITIGASGGSPVDLPYGDGAGGAPVSDSELLYFCVPDQLDTLGLTLTSPSYSATTTGLNPWDITLY